jgi:diamine N-acetyltransferase
MKEKSKYKISYRALEPDDISQLYLWENDLEISKVSLSKVPFSKYVLGQYISQAHLTIQQTGQFRFMLLDEDKHPIGCVDLFDYDAIHRRAAIGILIDPNFRSLGYASQAIHLIKDYSFNQLGLKQLYCSVGAQNIFSIRLFTSQGFVQIGLKKDWIFKNGVFDDVIDFQCINPYN